MPTAPAISQFLVSAPHICSAASNALISRDALWVAISVRQFPNH